MTETLTLLLALITLNVADWGQTLDIARNPTEYHEYNPILGDHPSVSDVNTYFAIAIPVQIGVGFLLEEYAGKKWRNAFWSGCIGLELGMVANNYNLGLKINF